MPDLDAVRQNVLRWVDEDGRVRDSQLRHRYPVNGTIGEVVSLTPPRVEVLSGPSVKIDAYVGPTPVVGELVIVIEVVRYRIAITGVQVV